MTCAEFLVKPCFTLLCTALLALAPAQVVAQRQDHHARAIRLFEESETAFAERRYEAATTLLREAYALEPEPVLLYNLARAFEELGDDVHALEAIDAYLASSIDPSSRTEALERRERIAARIALRPRPPVDEPPPTVHPPADETGPIAVTLAGAAFTLVAVALSIACELMDARAHDPSTSVFAALDAVRDRDALAIARDVLGTAGAATMLTGGIWLVLLPRASSVETSAMLSIGGAL